MEKDKNQTTEKATETKRRILSELFDIAVKLPERELNRLEGVITGMQLATTEKAG